MIRAEATPGAAAPGSVMRGVTGGISGAPAVSIVTVSFAAVQADAAAAVLGTPDFGGPTLADFAATAGVGGGLWSAASGAVSFDPDGDFAALLLGASSASTLEVTLSDGSKRRLRAPVAGVLELAWAFNGAAMAATGGFVTGWTSETGALGTVTLTPTSATGHSYTTGVEGVAYAENAEAGEFLGRTLTMANSVSQFGITVAVGLLGASSGILGRARTTDGTKHLTVTYTAPSTITATHTDGTSTATATQTWNGDPQVSVGVAVNSVTNLLALTVSTSTTTAATSATASIAGFATFDADVVEFAGALGCKIFGVELASPTAFSAAGLETAVETAAGTYHLVGVLSGLVGLWSFGGSLTSIPDLSGNGKTATLVDNGAGNVTLATGASSFDGAATAARYSLGSITSSDPISLSGASAASFVYKASLGSAAGSGGRRIIDKSDGGAATNGWGFWCATSTPNNDIALNSNGTPTNTLPLGSTVVPQDATRRTYGVSIPFGGGTQRWYREGTQILTTTDNVPVPPTTTTNAAIGNVGALTDRMWVGEMDFVAVFNRALTAGEHAAIAADPRVLGIYK